MNTLNSPKTALAAILILAAGALHAETFTGRINGHSCAHGGTTCPLDRLDPHLALERDFVLQGADGHYVFLTNVPRDTKVRHVLKQARVTGKLDDRYNTLVVDEFQIKEAGAFKTVWTQQAQSYEWTYLQGTDGLGPVVGRVPANVGR